MIEEKSFQMDKNTLLISKEELSKMIPIDKVKEIALKAWIEGYGEGWEDADIPDIFRVWFH